MTKDEKNPMTFQINYQDIKEEEKCKDNILVKSALEMGLERAYNKREPIIIKEPPIERKKSFYEDIPALCFYP